MSRPARLLALLLGVLFVLSLFVGSNPIPVFQALLDRLRDAPSAIGIVLAEVRLPRTLIAIVAGAALGVCGAALQGFLHNPLASPGLIGTSSGAAFGAVVALYFGFAGGYGIPLAGMLGALLATLLVYLIAGRDTGMLTLILAGVAINALLTALISLLLSLAPSPYAVQEIVVWMLRSISNHGFDDFWLMLPGALLGGLLLFRCRRALDALTLGEDTATTLGIDLRRTRALLFAGVALAMGSVVSITGAIGFVGLITPHLLRPLAAHRPGRLLALSALGGAGLLLAADIGVRLLQRFGGVEIKVGIVTALLGAPFFLWLILHHRRSPA